MKIKNTSPSESAPQSALGIPANDSMEKVRPGTGREAGLSHGGDTSPWMGEGRTMQEQLSRATQEAKAETGI